MTRLRPVVLSGGSGTRLWPLSTPELPKQFVPLFGDRSLFRLTLARLDGIPGVETPIVVTGSDHVPLVADAIELSAVDDAVVVVEPKGRNTAPAAIASALVARPDDVLVILPSDHLVSDVDGFRTAVEIAARHAGEGSIVTFGIEPSRPETGYGYIEKGEAVGGRAFQVRRFKEKPGLEDARVMVGDGKHVWNSGMFVARADRLLAEARHHCPSILEGVRRAIPDSTSGTVELGESFAEITADSIDYAIMEKTDAALVIPIDVGWDDIGSYQSLLAAVQRDPKGNHATGDVVLVDVEGSLVWASTRKVAVVGLRDVVVVEAEDGVLVLPLERSQEVREIVRRAGQD